LPVSKAFINVLALSFNVVLPVPPYAAPTAVIAVALPSSAMYTG